jgi:hypothetical protein
VLLLCPLDFNSLAILRPSSIHVGRFTRHFWNSFPMRRENPIGQPVPEAGDAGKEAVPVARRRKGLRIPTIATTRSDASRPAIPIDRDQCGADA